MILLAKGNFISVGMFFFVAYSFVFLTMSIYDYDNEFIFMFNGSVHVTTRTLQKVKVKRDYIPILDCQHID